MSSRSRRSTTQTAAQKTLSELAELRRGGVKRSSVYNAQHEDDVYDLVTDEQYEQIVQQRRDDENFVEDDGGDHGYGDDGEEDDWAEHGGAREVEGKGPKGSKRRKKEEEVKKPTTRVSSYMLNGRREGYVGPGGKGTAKEERSEKEDNAFLGNLLDELDDAVGGEDEGMVKKERTLEEVARFAQQGELEHTELEYIDAEDVGTYAKKERSTGDAMTNALFGSINGSGKGVVKMETNDDDEPASISSSSSSPSSSSTSSTTAKREPEYATTSVGPRNAMMAPRQAKKESTGMDWFKVAQAVQSQPSSYLVEGDGDTVAHVPKTVETGDGLRFYIYDIHEEPGKHQGSVFLFGRLLVPGTQEETASCCVRVENIERNLFVLPRAFHLKSARDASSTTEKAVGMQDVWSEVKAALNEIGVSSFKSKPVQRRYCFSRDDELREVDGTPKDTQSLLDPEQGIPQQAEYLKVVYPFKQRNVPRELSGKTFSKVLNSKASARETLIMKRDIMGAQWLTLTESKAVARADQLSWCKYEFVVENQKAITKWEDAPAPPPLSVLSLSMQTTLNAQHRNEVLMVTGMFHAAVSTEGATADENRFEHFSLIRNIAGRTLPLDFKSAVKKKNLKLTVLPNERALLNLLLTNIQKLDPDVVTGHDLHGFQFETLMHRMHQSKLPHWSKLGHLKKTNMPNMNKTQGLGGKSFSLIDSGLVAGRIMCDTMVAAKEFLGRESSYDLTHLAETQLKVDRKEVDPNETAEYFQGTAQLLELVGLTENDCFLTLQLMFKLMVLPLTKTLTCLCGNIWNRSLRSARAERVEYLLLHEFHKLKFISPEKFTSKEIRDLKTEQEEARGEAVSNKGSKKRGKPQYAGGLVLEPKKGFYDKYVLLLDFASLYPSIIREFNICFTTIKHWEARESGAPAELPEEGSENGILPRVITRLLERRKAVKGMIKSERNDVKKKQLDIRQLALKLVANSMYGCLGFGSSRFYCQSIASLITSQGRDILQKTVDLTNSLGYPVIYGDTDSIMVNTNQLDMAAVREIGKTIRKEVNKRYSILEIELDGIFKNMLLLKKKKYACLTVVERPDGAMSVIKEIKGLDMVRRDWSQLSKDVGDFCLNEILSNKSRDEVVANIHDHLRRVKEAVMANTMPLEKYIIYKGLTKAPNEYPDKNNQPHVCVALKMIADGKTVRVGDHIPYIICKSEEKGVALRAQHPDTIEKSNGALVVDSMWYLSNQVHPPTARLLDPLEETDAAHIADCLGLDSRRFHAQSKGDDVNDDENTVPEEDDEERFKGCDRLVVPGGDGKGDLVVEGVFRLGASKAPGGSDEAKENGAGEAGEGVTVGELLDRTNAADPQPGLVRLSNALELAIRRHVDRYYKSQAQSFSVKGDEEDAKDGAYSARDLYTQLCYFQSLFDVERARRKDKAATKAKSDGNPEVVAAERVVSNHAESVCRQVHSHLEQVLRRNAYHYVSLKRLFTFAFSTQKV